MNILDETLGPIGWQKRYYEAAGLLFCDLGIYDPETKTYKKLNNGETQIDQHTGNQLSFTNVFVLETDIWIREDGYHKGIDWNGGDWTKGYYISNGYAKPITWSKADEYSMIKFWNEDGSEVEVNKGKSYISLNVRYVSYTCYNKQRYQWYVNGYSYNVRTHSI